MVWSVRYNVTELHFLDFAAFSYNLKAGYKFSSPTLWMLKDRCNIHVKQQERHEMGDGKQILLLQSCM